MIFRLTAAIRIFPALIPALVCVFQILRLIWAIQKAFTASILKKVGEE
jgi:hypothetical protein